MYESRAFWQSRKVWNLPQFVWEEKYLATHDIVRFEHPHHLSKSKLSQSSSSSKTSNSGNQVTDQRDVSKETLETMCELTEIEDRESGIKTNNQRKSYTRDFKIKTQDLLDTMKELKAKKFWEKVPERGGLANYW